VTQRTFGLATRAIHAGQRPDPETGARVVPIYQNASFVFESTEDAGNLFALQKYGNVYSRIANPTVAAFEECIASLEGGIGAVAAASGLAAQFAVFAALTGAGDHIVAAGSLYGGTVTQLDVSLRRFGVDTTFVPGTEPADYAAAITDRTKLVYAEVARSRACSRISSVAVLRSGTGCSTPALTGHCPSSRTGLPPAGGRTRSADRRPCRSASSRQGRRYRETTA
jgi:O-acetylhomoserine/O-acetylserine sulfhydrylase-like pyridoxal-dependent enzyme